MPEQLPPGFLTTGARHLAGRTTLWDDPSPLPIETVRAAREFAERQVLGLRRLVFPLLGAS